MSIFCAYLLILGLGGYSRIENLLRNFISVSFLAHNLTRTKFLLGLTEKDDLEDKGLVFIANSSGLTSIITILNMFTSAILI
jgi:hypothetical protein